MTKVFLLNIIISFWVLNGSFAQNNGSLHGVIVTLTETQTLKTINSNDDNLNITPQQDYEVEFKLGGFDNAFIDIDADKLTIGLRNGANFNQNNISFNFSGAEFSKLTDAELNTNETTASTANITVSFTNNNLTVSGLTQNISEGLSNGEFALLVFNVKTEKHCLEPDIPNVTALNSSICLQESTELNISGNLNDASSWYIYTDYCGGTLLGTTTKNTFNISPTKTTSYYISGEGGCIVPGSCAIVSVIVNSLPNKTVTLNGNTLTAHEVDASYQWVNNDNNTPIDGEKNQTFSPNINGSYKVIIIKNGCSVISESITINTLSYLKYENSNKIVIYPNPSREVLTVKGFKVNTSYKIYNVLGFEINKGNISNKKQIGIRNLKKGMYFLKFENGYSLKFIKE